MSLSSNQFKWNIEEGDKVSSGQFNSEGRQGGIGFTLMIRGLDRGLFT